MPDKPKSVLEAFKAAVELAKEQDKKLATKKKDSEETKPVVVPEVIRGEKLVKPDSMSWQDLSGFALRMDEQENTRIEFHATIDCFPYEGAFAMWEVMKRKYGYADVTSWSEQGMFGPEKHDSQSITLQTSPTTSVQVPWGAFRVPGVEGYLRTDPYFDHTNHRWIFSVYGEIKQKDKEKVNSLVEEIRAFLRVSSLYQGKIWGLTLTGPDGDDLDNPIPEFFSVPPELEKQLVFSSQVQNALDINLFNLIDHRARMLEVGFPPRWGVLLAGDYGTGKTMIASVTALKCLLAGITFIQVSNAYELARIVPIGMRYTPCVVFCEDIDRVAAANERGRTPWDDQLLNIIDGVKSKSSEVILVLTTNNSENINPALLRPGRLDAVISIEPPDAEAAERLLRVYGGSFFSDKEDLTAAAQRLAGEKTAVARAVVEKSKSAWMKNNPGVRVKDMQLTGSDVLAAVDSMENQLNLLNRKTPKELPVEVQAATVRAEAVDRQTKVMRELGIKPRPSVNGTASTEA